MKNIALLLIMIAITTSQSCGKGGLTCSQGNCHYPKYIEGCLTYSADNSCSACEYNYQLSSGRCIYAPNLQGSDCCSQFNNGSICIACSNGLFLNTNTNLCEDKKIQGCLVKSKTGCLTCAYDFDLVGSICIKSVQGCTAYDQYYNCISCNASSQLFQGICVPVLQVIIVPNCQYVNEFGCAQCNKGLRINSDGSCTLPVSAGCVAVKNDGTCLACDSPAYQLQNGQCITVGCLQYNGSVCVQCNTGLGFILNNQICTISNCVYYDSNGCNTCQNGLIATSSGCKNSQPKVCIICKINEYLGLDNLCHPRDVHCVKYLSGVCANCCDEYFLDQSNNCQVKQYGCIYDKGLCTSCVSPFSLNNGSCFINGCTQYNSQGCITCDSRLQLINSVCGLPNCEQIEGFSCVSCKSGFQLSNTKGCIPIDVNCAVRNSLNVCLKCKQGYQFDCNNICVAVKVGCNYVDGICTSCRAPFTYVPESKSCIIDGCLTYFLGGCSQCENKYTLLYNKCKLPNCLTSMNGKCLQCDPDYVFTSQGICVSKDEFCQKMDAYGTCIKCMTSYYYNKDLARCSKRLSGCIYNDNGRCVSCASPFTFSNGQCIIQGCLTLSNQGCAECAYPYQLTSKYICEIPYCNAYKNGVCIGCVQGYALNNKNLCVTQDPYCLNYNIEQTKCLQCIKGYKFDSKNRCEYGDQHCWTFDQDGICTNCDRIYFLNPYGKCQLRDPQCKVYTNGYCTKCSPYYFVNSGVCFANLKGCQVQKSYSNCLICDSGYNLQNGVCKVQIVQLTWNSIDMDFNEDSTEAAANVSRSVFTNQFTSTTNLIQAFTSNSTKVFFSSSSLNDAQFQVDSPGSSGWSPIGTAQGAFIGIQVNKQQTFYALDLKSLAGSSLKSFVLDFSLDGKSYTQIGSFSLEGVIIGSVKTFYFKPVFAKYIRIIVQQGTPNIKFEFYYSSKLSVNQSFNRSSSYIEKTVLETIDGALNGGISTCKNGSLCWAGVQACQPKKLSGFSLIYTNCTTNDFVQTVKIDYSMDGITFSCWNNCLQIPLNANGYTFTTPILAQKVHVHFTKYQGTPHFGIKFVWAQS